MATDFVLIHGGGATGEAWRLVRRFLEEMGHRTITMDLPAGDPDATWADYAKTVVEAASGLSHPTVVSHSAGAFTAPLVCEELKAGGLVLVAPTIPRPGERFMDFWSNTGQNDAQAQWLQKQGIEIPDDDTANSVIYYHDVPKALQEEDAERSEGRVHIPSEPWPANAWPDVPTRVLACRDDRLLPLPFIRDLASDRLGVVAEEIEGGHCVLYSQPRALAERLVGG